MKILTAQATDSVELTSLTKQSKAYWGYSAELIEKWEEDLTVTPQYIQDSEVFLLHKEERILGYYSFVSEGFLTVRLDNMFLHPSSIGQGYGKLLMNHFIEKAQEKGFKKIILEAEPGAQAFYEKFSFKVVGKRESNIKDRFLPIMQRVI